MTICTAVSAHVHDSGSLAVPARLFADIINRAPADALNLATSGQDLTIASGGLSASLRVVEGEPPPDIRTTATVPTSTMTDDEARRAAALTAAASKDPQRPVLTGVHLGPGRAEATDSHRAARTPLATWNDDMIVSAELIQLLPGHGDVSVRYDGRVASFTTAQTSWAGPVVAAQFPSLEAHFAIPELYAISCDRAALRGAVETAAVMPGVPIDLLGTGQALAVSAESTELGRVETLVPVDARTDIAASFTGSYLRDALQMTAGAQLTMRFGPRQVLIQCDDFTQLVLRVVDR